VAWREHSRRAAGKEAVTAESVRAILYRIVVGAASDRRLLDGRSSDGRPRVPFGKSIGGGKISPDRWNRPHRSLQQRRAQNVRSRLVLHALATPRKVRCALSIHELESTPGTFTNLL
jgi:hypothetical protein